MTEANQIFWDELSRKNAFIQQEFIASSKFLGDVLEENQCRVESTKLSNFKQSSVHVSTLLEISQKTPVREMSAYEKLLSQRPPESASFWEKLAYNYTLSQVEQEEANRKTVQALNKLMHDHKDDAQYIVGFISGDFNKNPTASQIIVGGLISVIPVADQICDIRDLIASVILLSDEKERTPENWVNLALVGIGVIPAIGSIFKTIAKLVLNKLKPTRKVLLEQLEQLESFCRKFGIAVPWGSNPEKWLYSQPWKKIATDAKAKLSEYLTTFQILLQHYSSSTVAALANLCAIANKYATELKNIIANIGHYIDDLCLKIEHACHEIMGQPKLSTANGFDIHIGGNAEQPTKTQHIQGTKTVAFKRMKEHKVGCFEPVDTPSARKNARISIDQGHPPKAKAENWSEDKYLKWETDRQLKMQQDGLNSMTVKEYEEGRAIFKESGRGSATAQKKAQDKYEKDLQEQFKKEYQETMSPTQAKAKSIEDAKSVRATLAALHNPDQIVGGAKSTADLTMGNKNVNSSLGTGWKNKAAEADVTRVQGIDNATQNVPNKDTTKMNLKLERCK